MAFIQTPGGQVEVPDELINQYNLNLPGNTDTNTDPNNTSVNPDANKTITNPDGSKTITKADGSSVTTYGDKSKTVVNSDGSKTITNADGSVVNVPAGPPQTIVQNQENITDPKLPDGAKFTANPQRWQENELLKEDNYYINKDGIKVKTATAQPITAKPAATYEAYTGGEAAQAQAAQGQVSQEAQVQAQQQQGLSAELKAEFDQFSSELAAIGLDPNETVQGQYTKLMDFGPNDIPAWAKGAYKVAQQQMASRGIQGSTIAGEAITTALMQAALPIAQQDAQALQTLKLTKLDKKAQGVFLRAGFIASLDTQNLTNRQQAAVLNAQSFLNMDLRNLDARQQTAVINTQARMQKMLSDQAAVNASRQFNATSQNQVDQFYTDLGSRIDLFNTSQVNGMEQFNANLINDRDKFNINNMIQIGQSNATYLRGINTANTALINQENMINSQNLLGISNQAMANALQFLRDSTAFSFQAGENSKDRAHQGALLQMQNEEWFKRLDDQQENSLWESIGGFVADVAGTWLKSKINKSSSSSTTK